MTYTDGGMAFCPKCGGLFDYIDAYLREIRFGHWCPIVDGRIWWNHNRVVTRPLEKPKD